MTTTVLVTNDDGIGSPGLHALARCVRDLGRRTVVAAPVAEASGTSAGLAAAIDNREIVVELRTLRGCPAPKPTRSPRIPAHCAHRQP